LGSLKIKINITVHGHPHMAHGFILRTAAANSVHRIRIPQPIPEHRAIQNQVAQKHKTKAYDAGPMRASLDVWRRLWREWARKAPDIGLA